jgi:hypothetical protein
LVVCTDGRLDFAALQRAIAEFRPFFDNSPVYGNGPSLEETMRQSAGGHRPDAPDQLHQPPR